MKHILGLLTLSLLAPLTAQAYDLPYIGAEKSLNLRAEDTMTYIARDYNLGYVELMAANPDIDPWMPGEGTKIILPLRHILPDSVQLEPQNHIIINLPEMRLYAFIDQGLEPLSFPIGIGRDGLDTPMGNTKIAWKVNAPTWTPTARMRKENPDLPKTMPSGPNNPLGTHALYLGWPEYLIHGTNRPFGIGRRVSSGCIRMYPEDIKRLYQIIPAGTHVSVINQPIKTAWIDGQFYIESHPTMDQASDFETTKTFTPTPRTAEEKSYISASVKISEDQINWDAVQNLIDERSGKPEPISLGAIKDVKQPPATPNKKGPQ